MEEIKKIKTKGRISLTPKSNKIIINELSNNNNDFTSFLKPKNFKLNHENNNSSIKNKEIINRKKLTSTPSTKRIFSDNYKNINYLNQKNPANDCGKRDMQLFSSNIFNKNYAFYKKLKIDILHKNVSYNPKRINLNLYKNITTSFLKQKKLNDIPITYPFYASFDRKYNSMSQRERYKKNLDKLIQVKTIISSNKDEHAKIISEFMIKNGVNEKKYINSENILKFENYLNTPFKSIPDLTMTQLIKNVINNKFNKTRNSVNKIVNLKNNLEYNKSDYNNIKIQNRTVEKIKKYEINDLKKSSSSPNINLSLYQNDSRIVQLGKKYSYLLDENKLVSNLKNELNSIKIDKINKLENQNKFNDNKIYLMKSLEDNNKYVPNLCLSSNDFSKRYKNNIKKYNNKLNIIMKRNEKIKDINRRMYYDSKKNKNLKGLELSDVINYHKITELVVLNKRKQELINKKVEEFNYDNFKNEKILNKFK